MARRQVKGYLERGEYLELGFERWLSVRQRFPGILARSAKLLISGFLVEIPQTQGIVPPSQGHWRAIALLGHTDDQINKIPGNACVIESQRLFGY